MADRSIDVLSSRKIELYQKNSEIIKFWRRNPCIACEDLLGIKLLDEQRYILQMSWNTPYVLWAASRNFGKSFLAAVLMTLKWLLYEDQKIYIVASSGSQSHECFLKLEDIALDRIASIDSLKDIFANETVKSPSNKTGFTHNPTSFHVGSYNNSDIWTLNSDPSNNRSKRSTLVFFDEAAFSEDELLTACIAFGTQDSDFKTSTKKDFNINAQFRKCPTQLVFASSQNDTDCLFYRKMKDYAMKMITGDRNYFVASIPCDVPLNPTMDGKPHPPLLKQEQIDDEMRVNREKALREYYNIPINDGGDDQIIKHSMLIKNSVILKPVMCRTNPDQRFIIALDPARTTDNSIIGVMQVKFDEDRGYYGEIINMTNLVDIGKKKSMPMRNPEQLKYFRNVLLDYNGDASGYSGIDSILIDGGSGGAGKGFWGDSLLEDWIDDSGNSHFGLIDPNNETYKEEVKNFPNAVDDKLDIVIFNGNKRTSMVEDTLELIKHDLIKFTKEYDRKGFMNIPIMSDDDEVVEYKKYHLSIEEEIALINIDAMKTEARCIHRTKTSGGNRYALAKDKARKMHDDRFAVLIMLGSKLAEIRRQHKLENSRTTKKQNFRNFLITGSLASNNGGTYENTYSL